MPPMPPMPPPVGIPGAPLGSGLSATIASVVINSPATEPASCSATRTTLVGSIIPAFTMSLYSPDCASKPKFGSSLSVSLPTTIEPSTPEFSAIWRTGDHRHRCDRHPGDPGDRQTGGEPYRFPAPPQLGSALA